MMTITALSRKEFLTTLPQIRVEDVGDISEGWPNVYPGNWPFGARVMVQLRMTSRLTRSGIALPGETQDAEKWNNGIAQVIGMGPLAFKKRDSLQPWPEGTWCEVGDFVRVPKFGGERWEVAIEDKTGTITRNARLIEIESELRLIEIEKPNDAKRDRLERERDMLKRPLPDLMVMFAIFNDTEMIASILGNPMEQRVYV
jgi:co-chaperonin GroES (HSP10)